ncbi:MAG TPA: hypothetical protein DCQ31_07935 [Bacteroidales bacterium]|nr:hypothetical protein [Bacteroidales bacterium]
MNIVYVPDLGETPAKVFRPTGTIFINNRIWHTIDKQVQKVILAHEEGHYKLQTADEFKADRYAFEKYALSEPGSLKALHRAITQHLDITNDESHRQRAKAQIIRILETDAKNGNQKAKFILNSLTMNAIALFNQLKNQYPEYSDEDLQLALYYATAVNSSISGYSSKKGSGLSKFFAKVGDKFGELMQKPGLQKIIGSAGAALGIPPAAISAGMQAIGAKIEAKSEAKLAQIASGSDADKLAAASQLEADRKAVEALRIAAVKTKADEAEKLRRDAEIAKNDAERKLIESAKYNAVNSGSFTDNLRTENPAGKIPMATWLIIGAVAVVAIYLFTKGK